jgi:hypothetical protein
MHPFVALAAPDLVAAGGYGPDSERFLSLVAAAIGLVSVVAGGLSLARSKGRLGGGGRLGGPAAMVAGLIGTTLSVLHLAGSTGGFGTGNGRAGAIVALVLGLVGINLGWVARSRSRRTPVPVENQVGNASKLG